MSGLFTFGVVMSQSEEISFFANTIIEWDRDVDRDMPWQGEQDPYLVWLSEILLQQTRVDQGRPYFEKFKLAYPTIIDLANAKDDEVFRLWQGLGDYSRCRNLLFTARFIRDELDGVFPNTYEKILRLKGVGPYTAAAVSSFAFGLFRPVVDGNVKRVVSRYFGILDAIDGKKGNETIQGISEKGIQKIDDAALYNQAIMNFGAIHCTPRKPKCTSCPLSKKCYALQMNSVSLIPFKEKKIKKKQRFFVYLHIENGGKTLIQQRQGKDIWQQLYQLPLIEVNEEVFKNHKLDNILIPSELELMDLTLIGEFSGYKQQLTHQRIHAIYVKFSTESKIKIADKSYLWVEHKKLNNYAFPKIILDYLKSELVQFQLLFK